MSTRDKDATAADEVGLVEPAARPESKYRTLPEPIRLDQVTTTHPASDPPAPDLGRDPDHDFMLRFGAG